MRTSVCFAGQLLSIRFERVVDCARVRIDGDTGSFEMFVSNKQLRELRDEI